MQSVQSQAPPAPVDARPVPPNADDLPYSDGMPMESARHVAQMYLLSPPLKRRWRDRPDAYVGMNMFVYFSADQRFNESFREPIEPGAADRLPSRGSRERDGCAEDRG